MAAPAAQVCCPEAKHARWRTVTQRTGHAQDPSLRVVYLRTPSMQGWEEKRGEPLLLLSARVQR